MPIDQDAELTDYIFRWECRAPGSTDAFTGQLFSGVAATPREARDIAFAKAKERYETRAGGEYWDRHVWRTIRGFEAPMALPCQDTHHLHRQSTTYWIRYECRSPGYTDAFRALVFSVVAISPVEARDKAFALAQQHYEVRLGGDWCLADGAGPPFRIWRTQDGQEAPMILPCQQIIVR